MILVTGAVVGTDDTIDELVALSLAHVRRSRAEPGCISHAVHRHVEDPNHLVFVEQWADMDALRAHFAVPASRDFVDAIGALSVELPQMRIYDATEVRP